MSTVLKRRQVVRSTAGRDCGRLLVVLSCDEKFAVVADGKKRRLASPKRKNLRHIEATNQAVDAYSLEADGRLRKALNILNQSIISGR